MWKGLALQLIFVLIIWFGSLHALNEDETLDSINVYGAAICLVNFILIGLWFFYTLVLLIMECVKKYIMDSVFVELYVFNLVSLIIFSVAGIIWLIWYGKRLRNDVEKSLLFSSAPFAIIWLFSVGLIFWWARRFEDKMKEGIFNNYVMKQSFGYGRNTRNKIFDEEIRPSMIYFDVVKECPTLIFQDYYDIQDNNCEIWDKGFIAGQVLKILPGWFHIFHEICMKKYYDEHKWCPNDHNAIGVEVLREIQGMTEEELIQNISKDKN